MLLNAAASAGLTVVVVCHAAFTSIICHDGRVAAMCCCYFLFATQGFINHNHRMMIGAA
jgi:hypothetical protein